MQTNELREAIDEQEGVEWEVAEHADIETGLGYLPSEGAPPLEAQLDLAASFAAAPPPPAPSYPPAIDLRQASAGNMITPIRSQGGCGSCVAFAAAAAVEGTLRVQSNDPSQELDLSEAYLFYCKAAAEGRNCGPGPQEGWQPVKALEVFKDGGVPAESSFPYTAGDQACAVSSDWQGQATTIADFRRLNEPPEMKDWLATRGPVVASLTVYEDLPHYAGGIYSYVEGKELGGHCICVVGYDDEQSFWIVKNSWGDTWGESGFFRIAYGQCGIDSGMLGIDDVRPPATA